MAVESGVPANRVRGGERCRQGQFPQGDIIWNSNTHVDKEKGTGTACVEVFSNRFGGFIGGGHRHKTVGNLYPPVRALQSAKQISICSDLVWGVLHGARCVLIPEHNSTQFWRPDATAVAQPTLTLFPHKPWAASSSPGMHLPCKQPVCHERVPHRRQFCPWGGGSTPSLPRSP